MGTAARIVITLVVAGLPLAAMPFDPQAHVTHRTHVMVTNDDGVGAPGVAALVAALAADPAYRVTVVAPAEQQSGKSHGIATRGPIVVMPHPGIAGAVTWSVASSPATATRIGLAALLADDAPALVLSGINVGQNDGIIAWYSGTVGAAREAVVAGVPAIAVSLELDRADPRPDWEEAARWAKAVVDAAVVEGVPPGVLLNVNIPRDTTAIRGVRFARMSTEPSSHERFRLERRDPDGTAWYEPEWAPTLDAPADTDVALMAAGFVVVAPLGLDQTAWRAFPSLGWVDAVMLGAGREAPASAAAAAR